MVSKRVSAENPILSVFCFVLAVITQSDRAISQQGSRKLAKGQPAGWKNHVNTGRVTPGHWPTVTPAVGHVCVCSGPSTDGKQEWLLKGNTFYLCGAPAPLSVVEPSHRWLDLFWGLRSYVSGEGIQLGLPEVGWWFTCVAMVKEFVLPCFSVSEEKLKKKVILRLFVTSVQTGCIRENSFALHSRVGVCLDPIFGYNWM